MVMLHRMSATAGTALLIAAAALPAQDIEPAASTPSSSPDSRTLTLADLGYPEGLSLTQPAGLTTIYFPAPIDAAVRDPKVVLMLTGGSLAEQGAYVQLRVNGQTRRVVPLAGSELDRGIEYVLPLTAADLGERFLALGLNHRFDPRRQYCGEQDSGTFLNISPRSYFSYELAGDRPASLRGWLSTLPAEVVLGVSGDSPTTLKSAWFAAHELRRRGRQVRFVTGAGPGAHILVGEASTPVFAGVADAAAGPPLRLVERDGARILLVRAGDDLALAEDTFRPLLIQSTGVPAQLEVRDDNDDDAVGLVELGLSTQPQDAAPSVEWHMSIATQWLPPRRAPLRANVDVIAAPALEGEPALLFSYLDGNLIQSDRLTTDGRPHRVVIDLDGKLGDDLRLLVRYYPKREECEAPRLGLPVQILAGSYLELETADRVPERFDQLAAYWRAGMRIHYDNSLPVPARLAVLTSLSERFVLAPGLLTLAPVGAGPGDDKDFIWLARAAPKGKSGPVRFDRGRIRIEDGRGGRVLDSAEIPGVGVWQILRDGDQRGLWIYPGASDESLDQPQRLRMGASDIAFVANGEVLLELDSTQAELARITYPEYRGWRTILRAYRYWIFVFAWILLTVGIVALYRRIRGSKKRT